MTDDAPAADMIRSTLEREARAKHPDNPHFRRAYELGSLHATLALMDRLELTPRQYAAQYLHHRRRQS